MLESTRSLVEFATERNLDAEIIRTFNDYGQLTIWMRVRKKHIKRVTKDLMEGLRPGIACRVTALGFFELRSFTLWKRPPNIRYMNRFALVRDQRSS